MARRFRSISTLTAVAVVLAYISGNPLQSQVSRAQRPSGLTTRAVRPVSLPHLYWHFLTYQSHLDTKATAITAQGRDAAEVRNLLQRNLGFSDAEFAPIRVSSTRLTAKVQAIDAQAVAIRATGVSPASINRLRVLTGEREADINAEIAYLKKNLSPDKTKRLEAFLTKFFSPNNAVSGPPSSVGLLGPSGVQK